MATQAERRSGRSSTVAGTRVGGMQSLDAVLMQAAADLDAIGARWAVIGGLAVAFRAEPRFTKDIDLAVAVADDEEAEGIVNRLQVRGYALTSLVSRIT